MSATVTIPIAGFKDVYEVPAVEKALQELPPSANDALRAVYEKMLRLGGQRFTVKPSALPEIDDQTREQAVAGQAQCLLPQRQAGRPALRGRAQTAAAGAIDGVAHPRRAAAQERIVRIVAVLGERAGFQLAAQRNPGRGR